MAAKTSLKESVTSQTHAADDRVQTKRSGRPREFDAARAADAALHLFWKNGYRGTVTRDLETALDLSQSSIYNTFGSKLGLLEAAFDRYQALMERELLRPFKESTGGLDAINEFFINLGRWVTKTGRRGCMQVNLMAEHGDATKAVNRRWKILSARLRAVFIASLARAAEKGEIPYADLEGRADMLLTQVLGLSIAARGAGKSEVARFLAATLEQINRWRIAKAPPDTRR